MKEFGLEIKEDNEDEKWSRSHVRCSILFERIIKNKHFFLSFMYIFKITDFILFTTL
jgi:hypothetical protein